MEAQQYFTIIAHRGDSSAAPENTVQAFDAALQQGFRNFETDCQLSSDGAVVIVHDEKLGRVNDGTGAVAEHTLAQLQQLDAGSWFGAAFAGARMPTLQQLLQTYKGKAHIHLELKSQQPQLPVAVASLLQQYGWLETCLAPQTDSAAAAHPQQGSTGSAAGSPGSAAAQAAACGGGGGAAAAAFSVPGITITSFHLQQLQASKQLLPSVQHGWLIQEVSNELLDTAAACGFEMLCPRANALTAEGVALIKSRGLVVRAWGVKTIELLHHVVQLTVVAGPNLQAKRAIAATLDTLVKWRTSISARARQALTFP
ncbi:hypothetical protein OEZ85_001712 [Tetradesmus obliquus]|uniref:glycerophosphodiester phosphodiesterase n=1 Tax=Tetradesmus obliquus TaxID=3088 RepID=A0ABY8U0N9_TETOB|nr:hypothetical protein OEZ85_001712 [Tetradesmus obliquus]